MRGRSGGALIVAIWVIAALSLMVMAFAVDAHMQSGINVYVRERNRVNRLVDAGQILAEVVITGFSSVPEFAEGEDAEKLLEDDRWLFEKRELKTSSKCTIGPILVDESDPDSGTVTVEVEMNETGRLNVNELRASRDERYRLRWEMMLTSHGLPEDFEMDDGAGRHKLKDVLIASWCDWCDDDDSVTAIDGEECGAEASWYEERYEDEKVDEEYRRYPRNGPVPDMHEISCLRGFRDYPQILTGGVLNPDDKEEDQIVVKGIEGLLGTFGSAKVNVNSCTEEQLLTVPGIFDEDDDEEMSSSRETAAAILATLKKMPDYPVDESRTWWPYRDWNDLVQRVTGESDVEIGAEAANYLEFKPGANSEFTVTITGESGGMARKVRAKCYVKDSAVRYTEWTEDPD